jgi:hypothetical protein
MKIIWNLLKQLCDNALQDGLGRLILSTVHGIEIWVGDDKCLYRNKISFITLNLQANKVILSSFSSTIEFGFALLPFFQGSQASWQRVASFNLSCWISCCWDSILIFVSFNA